MDARRNATTPAELVEEVGALMTGLGVLSVMAIPFALPALLLTLVLVVPLAVLALPVVLVWLAVRGARALRGKFTAGRATRAGMAAARVGARPGASA